MPKPAPHLVVAISPHGFGHAALTAPVVNALRARAPGLRLTLRTTVSPELLKARFQEPWDHVAVASDFGMVMASAIDVLVDESARAYARLHEHWDAEIERETAALTALQPALLLCNVPYLSLAAAAKAGIPALALCSLNWADIYAHYCGHRPEAPAIHARMLEAYRGAECFLLCEPSMPMTDLPRRRPIGPVATVGRDRRSEIVRHVGADPDHRLVVIAPGGIAMPLPVEEWPRLPGVRWLVPATWKTNHPDATAIEALDMPFVDVLRSSDAVIGKPGYGTFVEAACNGTPVLYVRRLDWPEEPYLIAWLERHGRCREITRDELIKGTLDDALRALWSRPIPPPVAPTGVSDAASFLAERITRV
ncbi:MAG: hypothetical protein HY207_03580 [Nitrospirae bacterium]|nr:hypothetical protein [Nitrospirota bacterium]